MSHPVMGSPWQQDLRWWRIPQPSWAIKRWRCGWSSPGACSGWSFGLWGHWSCRISRSRSRIAEDFNWKLFFANSMRSRSISREIKRLPICLLKKGHRLNRLRLVAKRRGVPLQRPRRWPAAIWQSSVAWLSGLGLQQNNANSGRLVEY